MKGEGLRYNSGKSRYDLVQADALEGMIGILTFGAQKYADRNWEKGMAWSKVLASLKRHIAAYEKGEDYDPESGKLHADHIQCNAHFLSAYYRIFPEGDDRPHTFLKPKKIGLDIDGVLADFVKGMMDKFPSFTEKPVYWNDFNIRDNFAAIAGDMDFWLNLEPLFDPRSLKFEPHCYITTRPVASEISEEWLKRVGFPKAPVYTIPSGGNKISAAQKSGIDVFVDDSYTNFVDLNNNGIFTYLMDASHNANYEVGVKRIKSLNEIV